MTDREPTLHETLADLGWSSSETTGRKNGRLVRCDRGLELGVLTAGEAWAELRARGLVDVHAPAPLRRFPCACILESLYGGVRA